VGVCWLYVHERLIKLCGKNIRYNPKHNGNCAEQHLTVVREASGLMPQPKRRRSGKHENMPWPGVTTIRLRKVDREGQESNRWQGSGGQFFSDLV
jgi:hypothetical protein